MTGLPQQELVLDLLTLEGCKAELTCVPKFADEDDAGDVPASWYVMRCSPL